MCVYILNARKGIKLQTQNLSQLVSAVGCPRRCDVCFQWGNKITNFTSGIRHCDIVFLMSPLHMTVRETDAQEMWKC